MTWIKYQQKKYQQSLNVQLQFDQTNQESARNHQQLPLAQPASNPDQDQTPTDHQNHEHSRPVTVIVTTDLIEMTTILPTLKLKQQARKMLLIHLARLIHGIRAAYHAEFAVCLQ